MVFFFKGWLKYYLWNVVFDKVVIFDKIYYLEYENVIVLNIFFFNLKVCVYKCFFFFLNVGWFWIC